MNESNVLSNSWNLIPYLIQYSINALVMNMTEPLTMLHNIYSHENAARTSSFLTLKTGKINKKYLGLNEVQNNIVEHWT